MNAMSAPHAIAPFLASLQGVAAPMAPALEHSLETWLPSYRAVPRVLAGNLWLAPPEREACFDLFARAILHGIADTVRCCLGRPWSRAEFSPTRLLRALPHLCTAYRLTGERQEVYARLYALHTRIVDHDGTQAGAQGRREAAAHNTLHELLTQIEPYLRVVLRFLASNVEHYRVSSPTRSVQGARRPRKETGDATQSRAGAAGR
jgi:hypothetical protein